MSVYGDQLAFFTEQFRNFPYFHMIPQPVASYNKREDLGVVRGVFQYVKRGTLEREGVALNDTDVPTLWTRKKLQVGDYYIIAEDVTYRLTNNYPWMFEGGFYCYGLESVKGNTDTQTPHPYVNLGQDDYA